MTKNILNIEEADFEDWTHGDRYEARLGRLSTRMGAEKLAYNITVLPPGKRAFPAHNHRVIEEMFLVMEGSGEFRLGDQKTPVRKGGVIACPPGGPETAHQLINTSTSQNLKFLAVSTSSSMDICEYPDSGKVGVYGRFSEQEDGKPEVMRFIIRDQAELSDYWEGE